MNTLSLIDYINQLHDLEGVTIEYNIVNAEKVVTIYKSDSTSLKYEKLFKFILKDGLVYDENNIEICPESMLINEYREGIKNVINKSTDNMIEFKDFKKAIVSYINFDKYVGELNRIGIDLIEGQSFTTAGTLLDLLWQTNFTEEAMDTINWFLFEYHDLLDDFDTYGNHIGEALEPAMWDSDTNKEIPMNTIEDLWNYVKDFRK
jgi:hypothetical protein